jgi:hypothetical protein
VFGTGEQTHTPDRKPAVTNMTATRSRRLLALVKVLLRLVIAVDAAFLISAVLFFGAPGDLAPKHRIHFWQWLVEILLACVALVGLAGKAGWLRVSANVALGVLALVHVLNAASSITTVRPPGFGVPFHIVVSVAVSVVFVAIAAAWLLVGARDTSSRGPYF